MAGSSALLTLAAMAVLLVGLAVVQGPALSLADTPSQSSPSPSPQAPPEASPLPPPTAVATTLPPSPGSEAHAPVPPPSSIATPPAAVPAPGHSRAVSGGLSFGFAGSAVVISTLVAGLVI